MIMFAFYLFVCLFICLCLVKGNPVLQEMDVPFLERKTPVAKKSSTPASTTTSTKSNVTQPVVEDQQKKELDTKINALRKWCNVTIQQECRAKTTEWQTTIEASDDTTPVLQIAQNIKSLKPVFKKKKKKKTEKKKPKNFKFLTFLKKKKKKKKSLDKLKGLIPSFDTPRQPTSPSASKLEQVKGIVLAALQEVNVTLRETQKALENVDAKRCVEITSAIKEIKLFLDKF